MKKVFNTRIESIDKKGELVDKSKLIEMEIDVENLLEVQTCRICNKKKVIYYFSIDTKKDEYTDICIECSRKYNEIICIKCNKKQDATEFYKLKSSKYKQICKTCIKEIVDNNSHCKICTSCKKELPATSKYFFITVQQSGYLESECKECRVKRRQFNRKLNKIKNQ